MDSESNTNRKGFLIRAGLAVAAVFTASSAVRRTKDKGAVERSDASQPPRSALARVRQAEGAVARKA